MVVSYCPTISQGEAAQYIYCLGTQGCISLPLCMSTTVLDAQAICRDFDQEKKTWGWARAPPVSQKMGGSGTSENKVARKKVHSAKNTVLDDISRDDLEEVRLRASITRKKIINFVRLSVCLLSSFFQSQAAVLQLSEHEKALKEFQCKLCSGVLKQPLSTPCGHHFCKPCVERVFKVCLSSKIVWCVKKRALQLASP